MGIALHKKKTSHSTLMTEGSIWKHILFFSIPLILGNMLQQLYNTVDSIVVGNFLGSEALAAVGSSSSLIMLLISFSMGAAAGAGVIVSQFIGAQNKKGIHESVHTALGNCIDPRRCPDRCRSYSVSADSSLDGHTRRSYASIHHLSAALFQQA